MNKSTAEVKGVRRDKPSSFLRSFVEHPASVDETYWQHSKFAMRFAGRLMVAGGAALVHAFVPALFETTASRMVNSIYLELNARHCAEAAGKELQ